jgi:hypothetical protein
MSNQPTAFTDSELAYLASQSLGRLATVTSPLRMPARDITSGTNEAA